MEDIQADTANEPLGNPRTGQSLPPTSSIWTDTQTDISLGALLSDTSLHAASYQTDPVAAKSDLCLQQIPFACDSFDAAIAAHIYRHSQNPQRAPSHSSFLDAEVTCDAFTACQKFASLKGVPQHGQSLQETKTCPTSRMKESDHISSSQGATGTKWLDSPSLFDLSLSSSCRILGGDSISLSGFLANSVDAFQDLNVPPT